MELFMGIRSAFIAIFLMIAHLLSAQQLTSSDYAGYIKEYKSIAIREMKLYKIPASITLAQGMIESGCGKSVLAVATHNHFGIKCQKGWTGETFFYDDDKAQECFRKYNNVEDSYRDHSLFLTTRPRYSALFSLPITDYKGWATGLKAAGYATNPEYAAILTRLIENNQLYLFDDSTLIKTHKSIVQAAVEKPAVSAIPDATDGKHIIKEGRILFRKNYTHPDPSQYEYVYTSELGRKVYLNCDVPFIFAMKGDNWMSIAKEFGLFGFQVYKQNDLLNSDPVKTGQILYLEPKKKKNSVRTYQVRNGDSMYSISQELCIKLPYLRKYNKMKPGDEPEPGIELKLMK